MTEPDERPAPEGADGRAPGSQHPGYSNYPPPRRVSGRRTPLPPLHPVDHPRRPPGASAAGRAESSSETDSPRAPRMPRKLTVTRVAALRSRELTSKGIATFRRAATADGADKSGLTALTYATMANFASDAAIAVALANTLFFSAATGEDRTKVALYLLITIAPFAIIAPLIGPLLDRLQHGRRVALATSFALRTVLAVVLVFNFDSWVLYPAALGMMVLSKSFAVLKSAVTPRVLPPEIDLVRVNSRLTVFGLVGGTIGAGAIAAAAAWAFGSSGALWLCAGITAFGAYLSMRIPAWVEVTEGEVPATLSYHRSDARTEVLNADTVTEVIVTKSGKRKQPLGRAVVTGLWGNGTIRILTGFLTLFMAFVAKNTTGQDPLMQAAMLGGVGAAAAIGNFAGNATGARLALGRPALIVVRCTAAVVVVAAVVAATGNVLAAALAALVAACASALAKVSLDASLQQDLPEESIASGFGRSETVLQLSWVFGGAMGVLLPTELWLGFAVVSVVLVLGFAQTVLTYRGGTLLPGFGGRRPERVSTETAAGRRRAGGSPTEDWNS
ncbi:MULTISPECIES: MFS transporter [Rhodococcus]|uniref:MFS transporter n=1 Tax=Rhodococcus rhodochrous TaxID=1829 RepID=A0AA46WX20_RHORH|nr:MULTISPECIES: MFS transporter [Rhodococcus]AYA25259.1 MFS transporter [Rhodococcus rhodochrous]MCB8913677.1 MFS transporter [Rhodococcus rhodochrous]MCD2098328.1 MFS transporter [Rhodococcus rhodochrous]MCD2122403.1 MFS transporter [Rhodococcus rhodochrous]MCQ4134117.1 MFS transporter [Rhodococcus rhodochrous]